jgi:hypothetical protein
MLRVFPESGADNISEATNKMRSTAEAPIINDVYAQ